MLRIRFAIVSICALMAIQVTAQTSNPFDLKWKSGDSSPAATNDTGSSSEELSTSSIGSVPVTDDSSMFDVEVTETTEDAIPDYRPLPIADSSIQSATESPSAFSGILTLDSVESTKDTDLAVVEELPDEPPVETLERESEELEPIVPGPTRNVGVLLIVTMLGLSVLVLTWAVNANRGFIRKIYRAAMNENLSALLLREQKFASLQYLYYIVYATFFINASLFLFLISRYSNWEIGSTRTPLLLFLGVLVGIYLSRHLFMRVLGSTFHIETETTHYNFNILLYNILAGIALIPINLFVAFGPETLRLPMIYTGLGLLGLLYLLRQLRGINMASHLIAGHVFQFFVYLCAVEILPVLVLFKYFITD